MAATSSCIPSREAGLDSGSASVQLKGAEGASLECTTLFLPTQAPVQPCTGTGAGQHEAQRAQQQGCQAASLAAESLLQARITVVQQGQVQLVLLLPAAQPAHPHSLHYKAAQPPQPPAQLPHTAQPCEELSQVKREPVLMQFNTPCPPAAGNSTIAYSSSGQEAHSFPSLMKDAAQDSPAQLMELSLTQASPMQDLADDSPAQPKRMRSLTSQGSPPPHEQEEGWEGQQGRGEQQGEGQGLEQDSQQQQGQVEGHRRREGEGREAQEGDGQGGQQQQGDGQRGQQQQEGRGEQQRGEGQGSQQDGEQGEQQGQQQGQTQEEGQGQQAQVEPAEPSLFLFFVAAVVISMRRRVLEEPDSDSILHVSYIVCQ